MFAGFWFPDAELRVLATAPMDGKDDLARALVIVRDDVDNECTQKLLARSHRHARGIPCGLEVFRESRKIGRCRAGDRPLQRRQSSLILEVVT